MNQVVVLTPEELKTLIADAYATPVPPEAPEEECAPVSRMDSLRRIIAERKTYKHVQDVYFVRKADGTGSIKIGVAKYPRSRLGDMQIGCPDRLILLAILRGGGCRIEHQLHSLFRAERVYGEWFRPHQDLLALIEMVRS